MTSSRVDGSLLRPGGRYLPFGAAGVAFPSIGQRLRLVDAAEAHRAIEARETVGKTVLLV